MRELSGQPIRVLYYNHTSDVSGAEIGLLGTAAAINECAEVVIAAPEGELLERARNRGLRVVPVPSYRARMSRNPWLLLRGVVGILAAGRVLRRTVREVQPDIVHANSIRAGLIAATSGTGSVRHVWHIHDMLPMTVVGNLIRSVALMKADRVVAISKAIQRNFCSTSRKLAEKTVVVYNAVDVNAPVGRSIRSELEVSSQKFVMGVVGQIAPWKRQHDAIAAFKEFARRSSNTELWIVGAAKFRDENFAYEADLRREAKESEVADSIRFLGPRDDVMNVMTSIDVLVVPSQNEPFGLVIIEAMLAGKPVIGTSSGGISEIVVPDETGILVPCGDVEKLIQAMQSLWNMKGKRDILKMGEKGRRRVLQVFSIEEQRNLILGLYTSLTGQKPRSRREQTASISS